MQPVMYLIANASVEMSKGKFGAQAGHAAVEAFNLSYPRGTDPFESTIINNWYVGGHHTKIVLMSADLYAAERYVNDRGFRCKLVIDEGRTEFNGELTPTFLAVEIVDKDDEHTAATFSTFKLYKEPKPPKETNTGGRIGTSPDPFSWTWHPLKGLRK